MQTNKILGYGLLVVGLLLIGFSLFQSYTIFTGLKEAPLIFKNPAPQTANQTSTTGIEQQIQQQVQNQLKQLMPTDAIVKILNLFSWLLFASLLIFGGGQLAGIGIKLLKG